MPVLLFLLLVVLLVPMSSSTASPEGTKTIYLIRHAESEENRRIAALSRSFKAFTKFSLPSSYDVKASTELLNVSAQVDSNVSEIGAQQIASMGKELQEEDFVQKSGIQLVAHSPLLRARETSEGMLGCVAPEKKAASVSRVEQLDILKEKTPSEWTPIYYGSFKERIASFEQWISEQPEDKIAVVGHSQYFKAMLGRDFLFNNCDVWQLVFDSKKRVDVSTQETSLTPTATDTSSDLPPQWSGLKQVYSCKVKSSNKDL